MPLRLVTPPTVEPVSIADIKADFRVDAADDDARLDRHISEAREWVEKRIQTKLLTQTWELILDEFPCDEITLPFGPVQSITSIKYDDSEGDEQTFDPTRYRVDIYSNAPRIFAVDAWPTTAAYANALRVRFVAGFVSVDLVPWPVKVAIRLKVQEFYDHEDRSSAIHNMLTNYYQMVA